MPPVSMRRSPVSTLPTVVSLSKLLHLIPHAFSSDHAKRGFQVAMKEHTPEGPPEESPEYMLKLLLSVGLVLLGGVFAGLTLALMGSDDLNLRVLATSSSDPKERAAANKVLRLLKGGRHWVLVVLLLSNVIVNESLPIFLDQVLGGGVKAVVVSTIMIVIFGEVIPQAVCVRYGLAIGGACAPLVRFMMIIFAPVAWPIAKLLDYILGHDEGHTYKKAELKSFLQFHREGEEPLRDDEIVILNGVLSLNDRKVNEIMTPMADCLVLGADKILDSDAVEEILLSGFSRIPVHEPGQPDNFIGMLLVKRLIPYNPDDEWPVSRFPLLPLPEAMPDLNCFQALDYFQTGRAHLLLISSTPGRRGGALGILSLEDLIEEIIGEEIIDETDRYENNHSKKKAQRKATSTIMRGIIERQRVINAFSRRPSNHTTSRNQSPAPAQREGILVQINETPITHDEPETMSAHNSPKANIAIVATTADGDHIIQAPAGYNKASGTLADVAESLAEENNNDTDDSQATATPDAGASGSGSASNENGNGAKTGGKSKRGRKGKKGKGEPFPTFDDFARAAKAFIEKYAKLQPTLEPGPERTNTGWEWRELTSKYRGTQGYLFRSRTVVLTLPVVEEGEELLLDEEEPPALGGARVTVEYCVVWSATYHVPMLWFRAWDETGTPLPLAAVVCLMRGVQAQGVGMDAVLLPGQPFPLLQVAEHPVTGEAGWAVHPCEVGGAVGEIVEEEEGYVVGEEDEKVGWLEAWFMLSDSVVDLSR